MAALKMEGARKAAFVLGAWVALLPAGLHAAPGFVDLRAIPPASEVRAAARDQGGFVWTAGEQGVCRYDGAEWRCAVERPARAVFVDDHGIIWAGLVDGSLLQVRSSRFEVHHAGRVNGVIQAIARVGDRLWIATSLGLHSVVVGAPDRGASTAIAGSAAALVVRSDKTLVAAVDRSLYEIRASVPPVLRVTFDTAIRAVACPAKENADLLVATGSGAVYRTRNGKSESLPFRDVLTDITAVSEDDNGDIWVATSEELFRLQTSSGAVDAFGIEDGLPHQRVQSLFFDAEGIGWAGTQAGLAQLRLGAPARTVGRGQFLGTDLIFAVTGGPDGRVWAATGEGIAIWQDDWTAALGWQQGFSILDIRTVAMDVEGGMWAGGFKSGLFSLVSGRATRRWFGEGGKAAGVRSLRPRSAGGLWVGLEDGGLGRFVAGHFRMELAPRAVRRDRVFDLLELGPDEGLLLALSHDGLAVLAKGELRRFNRSDGLPEAEILCLLRDSSGTIWIGSNGAGLLRLRGGKLATVTTAHGLADNRIFGLVEDDSGRIWMSSPLGIAAVERVLLGQAADGKIRHFEATLYGAADGVMGEPVRAFPPSAYRSADGMLWFPSLRGLINVDPRAATPARGLGPVVFDDVQVNGHSVLGAGAVIAAASSSELSFRFTVPFFRPGRQLSMRYQLEGLEDVWHESQQARSASYQRVPPGRYRFRVRASAPRPDAATGAREASFELQLPRLLRDTLPFRVGLGLLVIFSLGLVHRLRLRGMERTHGVVLAERSRIARDIHDSLEQDLSGLRLQIEAAVLTLDESPSKTRQHLVRASELITDGVVDLRNSIWGLRASDVSSSELLVAVRTRLERLTAGTGVNVNVVGKGESRILPASVAAQIVHVAREAATNAIKHANARTITITLDTSLSQSLRLQVADDGQGLSASDGPPRFAGGVGLPAMHARAKAIGGTLTLTSKAGEGTLVSLVAPTHRGRFPGWRK